VARTGPTALKHASGHPASANVEPCLIILEQLQTGIDVVSISANTIMTMLPNTLTCRYLAVCGDGIEENQGSCS